MAGSKGKGSVTSMVASILEAQGLKAARYMSPHVSDFRERVSLGNSFFDEDVYCVAGDELRDLVENRLPVAKIALFDPATEEGEAPTYFELLTLFYFLCARAGNCDVMVVETGMGGRLDCTNVVMPLVSAITLIELEHTEWLGNTIAAIAGEKAGIIKTGRPVVLARQKAEALEVFQKRAAERNSPLFYFPEIASVENIGLHPRGTDFSLVFNGRGVAQKPQSLELSIPIPGIVQAENAGIAVSAVKTAFPDIGDDKIRQGLERAKTPARFEKIAEDPPFVLDGAHTPESVSLCVETFCSLYGEGGLLLFSCAADKNVVAMAELLLPRFSQVIVTTPGNVRSSNPDEIFRAFSSGCAGLGASKTTFVRDTAAATRQTLELSRGKGIPVLCTGSFYLAAEVRGKVLAMGKTCCVNQKSSQYRM